MKDRELYVLVKYAVRQTGCFPFTWQNWIIPVGKSNGFGIQFGKQVSKYGLWLESMQRDADLDMIMM